MKECTTFEKILADDVSLLLNLCIADLLAKIVNVSQKCRSNLHATEQLRGHSADLKTLATILIDTRQAEFCQLD